MLIIFCREQKAELEQRLETVQEEKGVLEARLEHSNIQVGLLITQHCISSKGYFIDNYRGMGLTFF